MDTATSASIYCNSNEGGYCSLYDPNGKRVVNAERDCNLNFIVSTMDLGTWKCVRSIPEMMKDIETLIHLKLKGRIITRKKTLAVFSFPFLFGFQAEKRISSIYETFGNYLRIGCRTYKTIKPNYCRLIAPDGKSYFIRNGVATDRMTTFSLDLNKEICSAEIKLPLLNEEKGTWKCYVNEESTQVNVEESQVVSYKKYIKENTKLNARFLLSCQVPYSSEYCYILSPDGKKFHTDENSNPLLGECTHLIEKVDKRHNGTWQCAFARDGGKPIDIIKYDVSIFIYLVLLFK